MKKMHSILLFFVAFPVQAKNYINNANGGYLGDNVASLSLSMVLAQKYNLELVMSHFEHADIFNCYDYLPKSPSTKIDKVVHVVTENDIIKHLHEDNVCFSISIITQCDTIKNEYVKNIKKAFQPNKKISCNPPTFPKDCLTIGIHIRKGNGGGQYYDGEQSSQQLFDFNRNMVEYLSEFNYQPFQWPPIMRKIVDKVEAWQTKFPPEQYYVDQLIKVISMFPNRKIHVQLVSDEKNIAGLINRLKDKVRNYPDVSINFHNNRDRDIKIRILEDLVLLSKTDILIRSQSYFARAAEIMGNNKIIIFPINFTWIGNKLIMNKIVIKKVQDL